MATHEVALGWTDHHWNLIDVIAPLDAPREDLEAAAIRLIDAEIEAFPQRAHDFQVAFASLYHRATSEEEESPDGEVVGDDLPR